MPATVVNVYELPMHGGSDGLAAADARDRRYFDVTLSAPDSNAKNIALAGTGIPALGDAYPGQNAGYCVLRRSADPHPESKHGVVYRVMVEYGINPLVTSQANSYPWLQDKLINWGSVRYDEVFDEDYASTPVAVVNSAEDPFDPPLMTFKYNRLATIRYSRLVASYDPEDASALEGTLNNSSFVLRNETIATEKALLLDANADEAVWSDGQRYWNISLKIEIERQRVLKNPKVLNKGYNFLDGSEKKMCVVKLNGKIVPASTAQLLSASGGQLAVGGTPTYKQFVRHTSASWSSLNL